MNDQQQIAGELCQRVEELKQEKQNWNRLWQDAADLVLPRRGAFYHERTPGQELQNKIYDSTAPWALEQLASGLHSYLTSPTQRWFRLALPVEMEESLREDDEVQRWLQNSTDIMFGIFNSQKTNFNPQAHELYLDLGAFGTGIMYVEEDYVPAPLRFCTYHLADCVIDEDAYGRVDTIGRTFKLEARQALQLWPNFPSAKFQEEARKNPLKKHDFVHFVAPRKDFDPRSASPRARRFASWYLYPQEKLVLAESGYNDFPFMVPRWSKLTGERYGRSPAMTAMPDIRMVNAMAKTIIVAAQKIVDPPLMMPDEGFLLPIKTSPGGINYYNSTLNPEQLIRPLETRGRVDIGFDLIDSRRQHIIRSFFVDWMNLQEGPQMTATEVMQRTEEKMRLMAPAISRQQSEFLDPLIDRVFGILLRKGYFGEVPQQLSGVELKVEYVSPVAKAQRMTQVMAFQRMMETLAQVAAVKPEIVDKIDGDGVVDFMADVYDVSYRTLLTDKQVADLRQQRAEAQAKQAQAEQLNMAADSFNKAGRGAASLAVVNGGKNGA